MVKKCVVASVTLSMVASFVIPLVVLAQSDAEKIAQLLEQIRQLQEQIRQLQAQQSQLQQQSAETVRELVRTLREGARGDDVKALQALLAADLEIYPEGLITGFYGRLTAAAVRRYQKKHGLEQVGQVGPRTLKKLNELLQSNPLALESATSTDDGTGRGEGKRPCAIVPPGHLIAPGWLRKQGGVRPIVPECQVLPPGIQRILTGTTTPPVLDTTAPVISNLAVLGTTASTTTVSWNTNESATSKVYYGTTAPLNLGTASSVSDATLSTNHSLLISGLTASTTHYYVAESKDAANNTATSSQQSFVTLP